MFGASGNSQPFCIVDLGTSSTKLVIIKEHSIYADSLIPVGIKEIQDNLTDYFGIHGEELSSWQENFSIASLREQPEYAELFQIIAPSLNEISSGINRFLQFYDKQNRNQPVSKLILTGGGALWKGMADFIVQETGIPSTSEFKLENLITDTSKVSRKQLHLLSNAIGLAMRGVVY